MLQLTLALALSQLVPAPSPNRAPPDLSSSDLEREEAHRRMERADPERDWAPRLGATTLTAAGAAGVVLALTLALEQSGPSSSNEALVLSLTALPFTALIASAAALGVHRLVHGKGNLWAGFAGLLLGVGAGVTLYAGVRSSGATDSLSLDLALGSGAAMLIGASTAAFLEWSHWRALSDQDAMIGLAPAKGGAVASLGWRF